MARHPRVPARSDQWIAGPALRSDPLRLAMDCPWTEAEILACFLWLRKRSALSVSGLSIEGEPWKTG